MVYFYFEGYIAQIQTSSYYYKTLITNGEEF